jgi:hypothetical protein
MACDAYYTITLEDQLLMEKDAQEYKLENMSNLESGLESRQGLRLGEKLEELLVELNLEQRHIQLSLALLKFWLGDGSMAYYKNRRSGYVMFC